MSSSCSPLLNIPSSRFENQLAYLTLCNADDEASRTIIARVMGVSSTIDRVWQLGLTG